MIFTILDTSQLKKTDDFENIYSENPLYLIIGKEDGRIECEKNESQYLVFDFTDENELLKKCTTFWDGIKNEIEIINSSKKR